MSKEIVKIKDEITVQVMKKVTEFEKQGELKFPSTYSPGNAIKSAFLVISDLKDKNKKPVLEVCTKESVGNALLKMVTDGLSPIKDQCYFIAYGNELAYMRSYQGGVTIGKRDAEMKTVTGVAVFKKDEFEFDINVETGIKKITKHTSGLGNFGKEIKGAYAIITFNDGSKYVEIMDYSMIHQSWLQGSGLSPAHKNFPDQMAIKTVKARACKPFINTTDDSGLMTDKARADSLHTIKVNANQSEPEIEDANIINDDPDNELTEAEMEEAIKEQDEKAEKKNKPDFG